MRTSLSKSYEYEKYFQLLGNSGSDSLFLTMKDVFMTALVLGFKENSLIPFDKTGGEPIKLTIFDEADKNIMDIIALCKDNDLTLLTKEREDEKYNLIEQYANGGMDIIIKNCCKPIPTIDNLKKFVLSYDKNSGTEKKVDISELLNDAINSV